MPFEAVAVRRELHSVAERSDQEAASAALVGRVLSSFEPDALDTGVGGHGVLATFRGAHPGPRTLIRCELDALPVGATAAAHRCGHDGHMAIVLGVGDALRARRPGRGSVSLLFQPAEETGCGAARVVADPRLFPWPFDWAFALHNVPGHPLGTVVVRDGVIAAGSVGLVARLEGTASHAAEPDRGRSPALAAARIVARWSALPQTDAALADGAKLTVTHVRVGEPGFGTSPGQATVQATLRAFRQPVLDALYDRAAAIARHAAEADGLSCTIDAVEPFPPTVNAPDAVRRVEAAAARVDRPLYRPPSAFSWSEDFGHITAEGKGALFGLGAGEDHAPLHHPDYEFPDALLPIGTSLLVRLIADLAG